MATKSCSSDIRFPLTPALSLRDRERTLSAPNDADLIQRSQMVLPLPEGEGWGEGERSVQFYRSVRGERCTQTTKLCFTATAPDKTAQGNLPLRSPGSWKPHRWT